MSNNRFNFPFFQGFVGSTGVVGAGWKLNFYATGATTTRQATYSDSALSVANANPVVADTSGRFGDIFLSDSSYNVVLTDENDATLDSADPVGVSAVTSNIATEVEAQDTTASQTVFTLTGMTYTPGTKMLDMFYNGVRYELDVDWQETSTSSVTWINTDVTISAGGRVVFVKYSAVSSSAPLAANTSYTDAAAAVTDVQTKLREIETDIKVDTVEITSAEILALVTPKTLVAAQGADTVIEFLSAVLIHDAGTAYVEPSAPDDLVIQYATGTDVSASIDSTDFLDQTSDEARIVPSTLALTVDVVAEKNSAIELFNTGSNLTTGTGTMTVKIAYRVHTLGLA